MLKLEKLTQKQLAISVYAADFVYVVFRMLDEMI